MLRPRLFIGAAGDFAAFLPPDLCIGSVGGRTWSRRLPPVLAAAAGALGVVTLDASGVVTRHGATVDELWRLPSPPGAAPWAISPSGDAVFDGQALRSASGAEEIPFTIDFFERWTFATFLPGGELALAFESGQPWSDYGSYGDRYGGVEVLARREGGAEVVSLEYDYRRFDASFAPRDVAWHGRGVLAKVLDEDTVTITVLDAPRGIVEVDLLPPSDDGVRRATYRDFMLAHPRALDVDPGGRTVAVLGSEEVLFFDVDAQRAARVAVRAGAVAVAVSGTRALLCMGEGCEEIALADLAWEPLDGP